MNTATSTTAAKAPTESAPLFYWNGIKDAKGEKLQRVHYSRSPNWFGGLPAGTISVTASDYASFSDLVRKHFEVYNSSDVMRDYFDDDKFRVIPSHPLYPQVEAAVEAGLARSRARQAAYEAKRKAKREAARAARAATLAGVAA